MSVPKKQKTQTPKATMKKKPKLLTTLLSGEKRRHHVAAYVTQEGDWNQHEPNSGFARMFIAMLILHVLIIGGIILSDSSSSTKAPPRSPAAQAILTKSQNEIGSAPAQAQAVATQAGTNSDGVKYETYEVHSGDSLPMIAAKFGVDREEMISLNGLDKDAGFSAGTVLKIPNHKVSEPLQISPARPLSPISLTPTTSTAAADTTAAASEPQSTAGTAASFTATTAATDSASGLVPLPDVTSTAPAPTPAQMTVVDATTTDAPPPAESAPVVSKSDSVPAPAPAAEKPAVKKTAAAAPKPRPVPTPSEMKQRPITKADSPPKADTKTSTKKTSAKGGTHTMAKGETLYRLSSKYGVSIDSLIKANNIKDPGKLRDGTKLVIPAK